MKRLLLLIVLAGNTCLAQSYVATNYIIFEGRHQDSVIHTCRDTIRILEKDSLLIMQKGGHTDVFKLDSCLFKAGNKTVKARSYAMTMYGAPAHLFIERYKDDSGIYGDTKITIRAHNFGAIYYMTRF